MGYFMSSCDAIEHEVLVRIPRDPEAAAVIAEEEKITGGMAVCGRRPLLLFLR